ncbi:DUF5682 family protein [Rhodospira trueperi]|uniref:Uncharacterized protein n=1 Tax=Rhodospira trueperi TaxID=69960 RepID=A0A1G7FPS0_9PROT|nr:DUF5682 family protein [Rhodospira trueperi]SDE77911.1 hypothetical protein SAMN05421720_11219 [Rhodospira trueperi]
MDDDPPCADPLFDRVLRRLTQADRGLHFAPIRHHSPACAWAVRQMIRDVRPRQVLIETPSDFHEHIPALLDPATRPPVAIAALIDHPQRPRVVAYAPYCDHSPEYVALREGAAQGARLRFIDLPLAIRVEDNEPPAEQPLPLLEDPRFDSSDYVADLARRTGCRDGFELWDHLFERQLGGRDWRAFFEQVGAYCTGIRRTTGAAAITASGWDRREAHMRAALAEAMKDEGPVVVVIGGFHLAALVDPGAPPPSRPGTRATTRSYLIRYGYAAMDALSGYAAGLPQPGYYAALWQRAMAADGVPHWHDATLDLVTEFAGAMRAAGQAIPVPTQVEWLRLAEGLGTLRGRPGAFRHDLIDAARSALVKGEAGEPEAWTARLIAFLRGSALGEVPSTALSLPLVDDARRRAATHRLEIDDTAQRRRKLDLRRKPAHLAASRFLHAMAMLGTGFARREAGPDFVDGRRTDLLFEDWAYAWTPSVDGRLIEVSDLGDDVPTACLRLFERRWRALSDDGRGDDLDGWLRLFAQGLVVGLGAKLTPFLAALSAAIRSHGEFAAVAAALRRLQVLALSRGPLGIPPEIDVTDLLGTAYHRLVFLCDTLPQTPADLVAARLRGLRVVIEVLRGPGGEALNPDLFDDAIDRVVDAQPRPEILGAVLALCVQSGRRSDADLVAATEGHFAGSLASPEDRTGVVRGVLATAPALVWQVEALLGSIDRLLTSLSEDDFLTLLPHLRLAFTALSPGETDRLARRLAELHGCGIAALMPDPGAAWSPDDVRRATLADRAVRGSIAADGLGTWLLGE